MTSNSMLMLRESKYGPGSGPQWKAGGSCYPNLCKALLQEPSGMGRDRLIKDDLRVKKPGDQDARKQPER